MRLLSDMLFSEVIFISETNRKHLFSSESLDINVGAGSEINQDWRLKLINIMALDMVHSSFYLIFVDSFWQI